jgi:hypothetical protein
MEESIDYNLCCATAHITLHRRQLPKAKDGLVLALVTLSVLVSPSLHLFISTLQSLFHSSAVLSGRAVRQTRRG